MSSPITKTIRGAARASRNPATILSLVLATCVAALIVVAAAALLVGLTERVVGSVAPPAFDSNQITFWLPALQMR